MSYIRKKAVNLSTKAEAVEAIGVIAGPNLENLVGVQIVDPFTHLRCAKHMAKNVFTATKRDILASFVIQSNVASHLDQMGEAHLKTDFHAVTYMRLTNLNLMTLSSDQDSITIVQNPSKAY